jgi:ABC-type multidrug transport system fused ATPase/permease subunit
MKDYLKKILYLVGDDVRKIPWMIVLFVCISIFEIASLGLIVPYVSLIVSPENVQDNYVYILISSIIDDRSIESLLIVFGCMLIVIFIVKATLSIIINKEILNFSNRKGAKLRRELLRSYQNMGYEEFLHRNSAEYIHSIQILATQFSQNTMVAVLRFFSEGIVVLAIIVFLSITDILALLVIASLLLIFIYFYDFIFAERIKKNGAKINQYQIKTVRRVNEAINGFKEIRVLGKEKYFYEKVTDMSMKYADTYTKSLVLTTASRYILELILIVFIVIMVMLAIFTNRDLVMLVPTLTVFGLASLRLMPAANTFSNSLSQLRFGHDATNIIFNDLYNNKKVDQSKSHPKEVKNFESLDLENISFSYGKKNIFKNISLSISKGSSIGIIGKTGSGKTTLINLILGLITPSSGSIVINKIISKSKINILKGISGYIPQHTFLVDDTIKKNIALGLADDEIDNEKVINALKFARLLDFVDGLPSGEDTRIGEHGSRLSGGQRQRLSLARAFYFNRQLLVMDEASSSLDNTTEQEIASEIKDLKGKVTTIIVAHRHSTLKDCDQIYEVINGELIHRGKYNDIV